MRKGVVFTMDSILALSMLLILALFVASFGLTTTKSEREYQQLNLLAKDALQLLSTLQVWEVTGKPTINTLINGGVLGGEDMNKTLLDLIGTFWEMRNYSLAQNVTREVLGNLLNDSCFKLTIGEEEIYSSCEGEGESIAIATKIESGYEIGRPSSGYIARAWATKLKKNTTEIIVFPTEGSGWTGDAVEVTKMFTLPSDITIYNGILYVSAHFGKNKDNVGFEELKVNGVDKKNDVVWLYLQESVIGFWTTTAAFGYVNITNELVPGDNRIYFKIQTPYYHSHVHPGMRVVVTYSLLEELKESNRTVRTRYYFDNVTGRTGSWATLTFFVPENARNVSATIHVNAKRVDDTRWWGRDATDVKIFVNSEYPIYEDGTTDNCYFVWNYYCSRTTVGVMDFDQTFDITNWIKNGTNIVSIYFNCYGDLHWGNDDSQIYSDPLNDPDNSSYVEVSYDLEESPLKYGEVDVTKELLWGGSAENPKTFSFNLFGRNTTLLESYVHVTQGFSAMLEAYAWNDDEDWTLVFRSPSLRATPPSIYIPPYIFSNGTNYVRLRDYQPNNSTSPINYILPWTSFEYTYIVKGIVGYGDVFNTSQEAINDAIDRLVNELGTDAGATDIVIENKTVYGIKWLWGPSLFKMIVWKP